MPVCYTAIILVWHGGDQNMKGVVLKREGDLTTVFWRKTFIGYVHRRQSDRKWVETAWMGQSFTRLPAVHATKDAAVSDLVAMRGFANDNHR